MRKCRHADLVGKRFGKLLVVKEHSERDKHGMVQWVCKCDCGNETLASTSALNNGHRTSCGCNNPGLYTANKRLYGVWRGMLSRCENPNTNRYHRYGGRGIKVCDEWHDFANFLEWSMNNGYDPSAKRGQYTIDRIDIDGDYSPRNCRWVDNLAQTSSTSRTRNVEVDGEKMCLARAADKVGISRNTVRKRVERGWSLEDAISIPPSRNLNNRWNLSERLNRIEHS